MLAGSVQTNQAAVRQPRMGTSNFSYAGGLHAKRQAKRHPQPSARWIEQTICSRYLPQEDQRSRKSARSSFHVSGGAALS